MAAKNMDYEIATEENSIQIKLVLPDGQVKNEFRTRIDFTVQQEKERIYSADEFRVHLHGIPLERAILVLNLQNGSTKKLDEGQRIKDYKKDLHSSEMSIEDKNTFQARAGRNPVLEFFGVTRK